MLRSSLISASAIALCASASAQSALTPQKVNAPVKDGGVYHVASGTWTRTSTSAAFNSDTLYCNKAPSGYFFGGASSTWETYDAGRIPSTSSPAPNTGTADAYTVDCFQIGYCTLHVSANTSMTWVFYDLYAPCSDPDNANNPFIGLAGFIASGILPGSSVSGTQSCWFVSFDLANTSLTFGISGDGDGTWDNNAATDSFAWTTIVNNNSLAGDGPLINGNCPPQSPAPGVGTVFNPGTAGQGDPNCTGLGTGDQFWIDGLPTSANPNGGCFFFGGCPGNPYASYWMEIFGGDAGFPNFCVGTVNSSGVSASISAAGDAVLANQNLTLTSTGLPGGATGLFFFGPMALAGGASLGNGALCAGGMTSRMQPPAMAPMTTTTATRAFNFAAGYASNPSVAVGMTSNFQFWFRDPMGGGAGSNSSDGVSVTWQ